MSKHEHEYIDIYNASGISRNSDKIVHVMVFCKKCLDVQMISYSIAPFKDQEEEEYQYD